MVRGARWRERARERLVSADASTGTRRVLDLTLRVSFGSLLTGSKPDQLGPTSKSTSGIVVPST